MHLSNKYNSGSFRLEAEKQNAWDIAAIKDKEAFTGLKSVTKVQKDTITIEKAALYTPQRYEIWQRKNVDFELQL